MLVKLAVKRFEAACEPGALDRNSEVFEPDLEQLIVGLRSPGKFPTWHGATKSEKPDRRSCHGVPKATTVNAAPGEVLNISRHLVLRQSGAPTDPAPPWASGTRGGPPFTQARRLRQDVQLGQPACVTGCDGNSTPGRQLTDREAKASARN